MAHCPQKVSTKQNANLGKWIFPSSGQVSRPFHTHFHKIGVTLKGKVLATKCIVQNCSQFLDNFIRLVVSKTAEKGFVPNAYHSKDRPVLNVLNRGRPQWKVCPRLSGMTDVCPRLLAFTNALIVEGYRDKFVRTRSHRSKTWTFQLFGIRHLTRFTQSIK